MTPQKALVPLLAAALLCMGCVGGRPILDIPGVSRVNPPGTGTLEFPVWSPDGRRLAADRQGSEYATMYGKIFVLERATGEVRLLVEKEGGQRLVQSWSPDGKEIAFAAHNDLEGIWLVSADGQGEPRFLSEGDNAAWSPTGQQMAIYSGTYDPESDRVTGRIWVLDLGTGDRRLVFEQSGERAEGEGLSWSPDGTRLAFSFGVGGRDRPIVDNIELYVLDLETGELHQLTHGGRNRYPTWSPDGSMIAFAGEVERNEWTIIITRADGTCTVRPLTVTGFFFGCAWSPDGREIAFNWGGDIYVMDIATVLGEDFLQTGPVCP